MFVKIYNQALAAESYQLDEIVGVGYRKALEFLIKDIAIHEHPEEREKIEGMHLSQCIEQYIDYTRLKTVAKGAAWLGNDQTHYKQKFSDKDISSLKDYLDACIAWVDVVLKTESADNFLGGTS